MPLMTFDQVRCESHDRYRRLFAGDETVACKSPHWSIWANYGRLMLTWREVWTKRSGLTAFHG